MNRNVGLPRTPWARTSRLEAGGPVGRRVPLRAVSATRAARDAGAQPCLQESRRAETKPRGRGGMGQRKATPKGEFSPATMLFVRLRAGRGDIFDALCEACGKWLGEHGGEFQHRDARGMGGSKDPVVNGPAGCVLLCHDCHMLAEARDRNMLGMGFWLENGQDPRTEPIMLHGRGGGGGTFYLAEDGLGDKGTGYLYQAPGSVAA
jgi:hypothetical protein